MSGWPKILTAAAGVRGEFERALSDPGQQQTKLLLDIVRANADCDFGRSCGFAAIGSVEKFQASVPVRGYEELAPDIQRMFEGEPNILTSSQVAVFEETSGSTSGPKLIPYTHAGLNSFRNAVLPWLSDLACCRPGVAKGPSYWSISPAGRAARHSKAGVPVGLASDAAYFGSDLAPAVAALSAGPPHLGAVTDIETWRLETLRHLLHASDLAFVSVWSPTFFTQLLRAVHQHAGDLLRSLHDGTGFLGPSAPVLPPDPERAADVEQALSGAPADMTGLWPDLDTISCWTDGSARSAAQELRGLLPGVHIQGKGLLATEAAMTIPWSAASGAVPALTSCFMEFLDDAGDCRMAHELAASQSYEIVVTTWNGFYRYRTGDEVRCAHLSGAVPALEFVGRKGNVSDLVGEKLQEKFVAACLEDQSGFCALVPAPTGQAIYWLVHDNLDAPSDLGKRIDLRLFKNPQYAYARQLGQLDEVCCIYCADADRLYTDHLVGAGMRLGDIKPVSLISDQVLAAVVLGATK